MSNDTQNDNETGAPTPQSVIDSQDRALAAEIGTKSVEVDTDDSSRKPRSLETRESEERDMTWDQARMLPTPDPRDGLDYRYVRISSGGTVDNMNHSQALRDRWEPALVEDFPELGMVRSDVGSAKGMIVLGGMMLCVRPSWIGDKIKMRIAEESASQAEGADREYFRDQDSTMRKFSEKSSRVTFGGNA